MSNDSNTHATSYPRPLFNDDNAFLYEGFEQEELRIQKCSNCGQLRVPPGPMCPHCQSSEWTTINASGKGRVHSYTIQYHPPIPPFPSPHTLVLVDLEEGVRFLAAAKDISAEDVAIDMDVELEFCELEPGFKLPVFKHSTTQPGGN